MTSIRSGASHHQKIIVVDDAVAFVSGYDLTRCRWDTSEHACKDPRRVDHRGVPYGPFHDVGIVVAGDCARALGDLASERWLRATGQPAQRTAGSLAADAWPDGVAIEATSIDVAIARTEPAFDGTTRCRGDPVVASRCDRRRQTAYLCREPVFHVAHDRRGVRPAPGGGRRARDRRAVAVHAKRLARDFHDGRFAIPHSSHAACGGSRHALSSLLPHVALAQPRARAASTYTARC